MPTQLQTALTASISTDPLVALLTANTFGKALYMGGDQYHLYAQDNTTLLIRIRARADASGALTLIEYSLVCEANHSAANAPGASGLPALLKSALLSDSLRTALGAGLFGNVVANGNKTYTVYQQDNKSVLCTFHADKDSVGNFLNPKIVRK